LPFAPLLPALLYAIGAEYGFPAFASPEEEYQEAPAEVLVGGLVEAT
jgi:hypothetical protein